MSILLMGQGASISQDTCLANRYIGSPLIIHFNGYSKCYLPLGEEVTLGAVTPIKLRLKGSEITTSLTIDKSMNLFSFLVDPDAEYEIVTYSSCNSEVIATEFSTEKEKKSLTVSLAAINAIENWQQGLVGMNFYEMIVADTNIHHVEKKYLLQQFLNGGNPIDIQYDSEEMPSVDAFTPPVEGNCSCRTLEFRMTRDLSEYNDCSSQFPGFACTMETTDEQENFWYWLKYKSGVEGPAKFEQVRGGRKRCNSRPYQFMEKNRKGVAILRFTLACLDGRWMPENCRCDQTVNVRYSYLSNLSTNVEVGSAFTCDPILTQSNKAEAYADDAAILVRLPKESDLNNANFEIDSFHRKTLFNSCGAAFEKDRFGDLTGVLFEGIKLALVLGYGNNDSSSIQNILNTINLTNSINNLQNYVTSLVTQPWTISEGACGNTSSQLFLEGEKEYILSVDNPVYVALITNSNVRVGGQNYWEGEAKVVSGYRLSGVIPPSFPTPQAPYCCTPALASYTLGSMGDAYGFGGNMPPAIGSLRNRVGTHLMDIAGNAFSQSLPINSTFGGYNITNELAGVIGKSIPNCGTSTGDRTLENSANSNSNTTGNWILHPNEYSLNIYKKGNDLPVFYQIFDINGRVINTGVGHGQEIPIVDKDYLKLSYYFITIFDGSKYQVFKFFNQ